MAGEDVEVKFGANISALQRGMADAKESVAAGVESMKGGFEGLTGIMEKVTLAMGAITAALAGGEAFGEAVSATNKFIAAQEDLMNQLGLSGEKTAGLSDALDAIGVSTQTYLSINSRLTMHLKTSEESFTRLGITTRDTGGHLLDTGQIMQNTLARLQDFKAGTDRNTVAIQLMGRGFGEAAQLLKLQNINLDEAAQHQKSLGLVVTEENIKMRDSYNVAMNDARDAMESVGKVIGETMIPRLTELAQWVGDRGVAAFEVAKTAMAAFSVVADNLGQIVQALWAVVSQAFSGIGDLAGAVFGQGGQTLTAMDYFKLAVIGVGDAIIAFRTGALISIDIIKGAFDVLGKRLAMFASVAIAALHGNWAGVKAAWAAGTADINASVSASVSKIIADAQAGKAAMDGMIQSVAQAGMASGGHVAAPRTGTLSAPADLAGMGRQKKQKVDNSVDEEKIAHIKQMSEIEIATEAETIKQKKSMGQISDDQELQMMQALENRKFEIEQQALRAKLALKGQQPIQIQKLNDEMEVLEAKHAQTILKINDQMEIAKRKAAEKTAAQEKKLQEQSVKNFQSMLAPITGAINSSVQGMIAGTTTMQRAVANIGQSIIGEFVSMGAKNVADWAANELAKTAATETGTATRLGIEQVANVQGLASSAISVVKWIMNDAAKAFSGVFSALAGIPFVGPALAAVAAPAAMATVAGVAGRVASSSGGDWQIPSDRLNFVHKNETILPADKSAGLDKLINSGSGGSAPIHIHGSESSVFSQPQLREMLKRMGREFQYVSP